MIMPFELISFELISFELWLAFAAASAILLVIPGPTILTVISYASLHGRSATLPLVAAVSLGDLSVISLSVLGLGSLLATSATAFTLVKIIGGVYLLFLGLKMMYSAVNSSLIEPPFNQPSLSNVQTSKLFFNTWLVTALNPKGIIFFSAFLPQFVRTEHPIAPQLMVLSITFIVLAALNTLAYALLASNANQLVSSNRAKKKFDAAGGLMMIAAGVWALTARQEN